MVGVHFNLTLIPLYYTSTTTSYVSNYEKKLSVIRFIFNLLIFTMKCDGKAKSDLKVLKKMTF